MVVSCYTVLHDSGCVRAVESWWSLHSFLSFVSSQSFVLCRVVLTLNLFHISQSLQKPPVPKDISPGPKRTLLQTLVNRRLDFTQLRSLSSAYKNLTLQPSSYSSIIWQFKGGLFLLDTSLGVHSNLFLDVISLILSHLHVWSGCHVVHKSFCGLFQPTGMCWVWPNCMSSSCLLFLYPEQLSLPPLISSHQQPVLELVWATYTCIGEILVKNVWLKVKLTLKHVYQPAKLGKWSRTLYSVWLSR